ncbi:hypothetical protein YC2023_011947 [Brassica napus]
MDIADDTAKGLSDASVYYIHGRKDTRRAIRHSPSHAFLMNVIVCPSLTSLTMEGTIMMVATCQVIIQFLSGEATLNGGTDTNGDVSNKVANPASQVVKIFERSTLYLDNAYALAFLSTFSFSLLLTFTT